jgi:hypothetical protein
MGDGNVKRALEFRYELHFLSNTFWFVKWIDSMSHPIGQRKVKDISEFDETLQKQGHFL